MRTLLFIIALSAAGQNLSVGFIGGASPTSDFQNQISPSGNNFPGFLNYSTPKHYIFGASLEYRLTPHFSIEADGLYHPLGYTFAGIGPDGSLNSISPATVVTWEFPVLAKYRFAFHRVSPFVEAGPSFRTTGNLNSANPSHAGVTGGVGVEMRVKGLAISPEVRYTRWMRDGPYVVATVPDQVELLVGFSAGAPRSNWRPMGSRVSFGAVLGVNLLGDFRPQSYHYTELPSGGEVNIFAGSGPRTFLPGAMVEVAVRGNFSVEADVIYDRLSGSSRVETSGTVGLFPGSSTYTQPEWKFPVLAKYRFAGRRFTPIAELGPSFRIPPGASTLSPFGATAGLGVEARMRRLRIAPVLRYTRWGPERSPGYTRGNPNQLEFLTGISF